MACPPPPAVVTFCIALVGLTFGPWPNAFRRASNWMLKAICLVCLAGLTLSGCAIFGGPGDRALRRSPNFRAGYSDGCAAATAQGANPREMKDTLAGEDKLYRRGYATGFQSCRNGSAGSSNPFNNGIDKNAPKSGRP